MSAVLDSLYGHHGFEFHHVTKIVPPSTEDEHWADAFRRFGGAVVISADKQIAIRPHKALAFIDNGLIAFFMCAPWSQMAGHEKAAHLTSWWPQIEQINANRELGRCWLVPCERHKGVLRLSQGELKELKIPSQVLEEARKTRKR